MALVLGRGRSAYVPATSARWPASGSPTPSPTGCYAYASTDGLLAVISVLGSLYPVATVLLARFVHHERLARVQQVGVAVALAGVVMIGAG